MLASHIDKFTRPRESAQNPTDLTSSLDTMYSYNNVNKYMT